MLQAAYFCTLVPIAKGGPVFCWLLHEFKPNRYIAPVAHVDFVWSENSKHRDVDPTGEYRLWPFENLWQSWVMEARTQQSGQFGLRAIVRLYPILRDQKPEAAPVSVVLTSI